MGLALSRDVGESIVLQTSDGTVRVKVCDIRGNKTKLYIEAPPSVRILREEVLGKEKVA